MYESRDETLYDAMPLPACIRHPESRWTMWWDLVQVLVLGYLAVMLPVRSCFELDAGSPGDVVFYIDCLVDFLFVVDLIFNFRTAYYKPGGVLEERPRR